MRKICLTLLLSIAAVATAAPATSTKVPIDKTKGPIVYIINLKTCIEESKLGKQEQASFESLKKQMESALSEKEKVLNDLAAKLEDPDVVDVLSAEAETEMKRKFRTLSQEYAQQQSHYMQLLQQANYKILDEINEAVSKAAAKVAQENGIDLILNEEVSFFYTPKLDVSPQVILVMDHDFDENAKAAKESGNTTGIN